MATSGRRSDWRHVDDSDPHDIADPSNWKSGWRLALDSIRSIDTEAQIEAVLDEIVRASGPTTVAFINAHVMNLIAEKPELCHWLLRTDYVFRDGIGMAILMKMVDRSPGLNLNGTDLIPRLLDRVGPRKIALLGTRRPWLDKAARKIAKQTGASASQILTADGFEDDEFYLKLLDNHEAECIILGMGVPKQERVACLLSDHLSHDCAIVSGGAILDFYGEKVTRAPALVRQLHMEWAYRLICEPRRLFRRYVLGNPLFLLRAIRILGEQRTLSLQEHGNSADNPFSNGIGDVDHESIGSHRQSLPRRNGSEKAALAPTGALNRVAASSEPAVRTVPEKQLSSSDDV